MSFDLVAYNLLKLNIQESINTEIREHGGDPIKLEESIQKLSAERRIQATYLLKTINLLDVSTASLLDKSRILNAATYYIRDQIGNSYKWANPERSTLFNLLTTSLVLNNDNNPDRDDLVDMYGPLEKFMRSHVYKLLDPRKGYLDVQPYAIEGYSVKKQIKRLAEKLFVWKNEILDAAEIKYQKELIENKPVVAISKGSLGSLFDDSTPETPKEGYELIKLNVQKSIIALIRSYNGDPVKLEESLQKVPADRRIQAIFLLKTIHLLDNSSLLSLDEKAVILNAAARSVGDEIEASYKWSSPEGSTLYKKLKELVFNENNKLTQQDVVDRYGPLEKFMCSNVYVESDPRKGYLEQQPYSIKGYSAKDHIKSLSATLFVRKNELFDAAEVKYQKELVTKKSAVASTGFFSGMFGGSTPVTATTSNEQGTTLGGPG